MRGTRLTDETPIVDDGEGACVVPNSYTQWYGVTARKLGVSGRLHDLRHFTATELLRAGVPPHVVSKTLGHASAAFTLSTYAHVLDEQQEQAADALEAAFGGGA